MEQISGFLYAKNLDTLIVNCEHPDFSHAQPVLLMIAELVQSYDACQVYKIRDTSLWQAAAKGLTPRFVLDFLRDAAKAPIPYKMQQQIAQAMTRWGKLFLLPDPPNAILLAGPNDVLIEFRKDKALQKMIASSNRNGLVFPGNLRAELKQKLAKMGYPVIDKIGYVQSEICPISLATDVTLRPYQEEAKTSFFLQGQNECGVIVLPCGSGKTVVGLSILAEIRMHTLIVVPNDMTAKQWQNEILKKTTATKELVGFYTDSDSVRPITIVTYQKVTAKTRHRVFRHLEALTNHVWGLVIYDEVHILPAPLFRLAAELQGARRLGLTATLVREDGEEKEVYSLIGPKCFEKPWKSLEQDGFIAKVRCVEIRVPLPVAAQANYLEASARARHRIAADNINKLKVVTDLCRTHKNEGILIMGQYIDFLQILARTLGCPFLFGGTSREERQNILQQFREGKQSTIVMSRIANMGIDLPQASIVIQISGLFGSRQEEAQRLGRLLRPKPTSGVFYSLVTAQTVEEQLAKHRQIYLVEQGYAYDIQNAVNDDTEETDNIEIVGMRRQR
jgi:DNA excision repair protein ERCC-3